MITLGRPLPLFLLISSLLLAASCATDEKAGTSSTDTSSSSSQRTEADQTSSTLANSVSGVQKDTLQACVGRIPSDASSGQRMLAEQSCQRDEAIRKKYPYRESLP
jgi:hypothetical protein